MLKACNMRATARLAMLISESDDKALLFEAPRSGMAAPAGPLSDNRLALPTDASADVIASRMQLASTLLSSALSAQQARFIGALGSKEGDIQSRHVHGTPGPCGCASSSSSSSQLCAIASLCSSNGCKVCLSWCEGVGG